MESQQKPNIMVSMPSDAVQPENSKAILVHVAGQVINPGVYEFNANERVDAAIKKAIPLADANLDALNLAETLSDGQRIYVSSLIISSVQSNGAVTLQQILGVNDKININKAQQKELESLPGIGPVLAGNIISYREANGDFSSIEKIKEVSGIGDKRYEDIKERIKVY